MENLYNGELFTWLKGDSQEMADEKMEELVFMNEEARRRKDVR